MVSVLSSRQDFGREGYHTPISQVSRLEVISTGARRRWTMAEKQRIVAESYSALRVVSATARRNGLSASQLFTWRRLARAGRLIEAEEAAAFAPAIDSGIVRPSALAVVRAYSLPQACTVKKPVQDLIMETLPVLCIFGWRADPSSSL
jgi:transposase